MPSQNDSELIAQAQAGKAGAISAIYIRFHGSVFRYLYYQLGDQQAAEDLTAEVFLKIIRALPEYRQGIGSFQTWVFRIARNLAIDHYRRMKAHQQVELNENMRSNIGDPDSAAERKMTSESLYKALAHLTDEQREVVILRFIGMMPLAEVARALEKSETAVKALQRRGLRTLRKNLADWE